MSEEVLEHVVELSVEKQSKFDSSVVTSASAIAITVVFCAYVTADTIELQIGAANATFVVDIGGEGFLSQCS